MPATLIPTSPNSDLYQDTVKRFWRDWAGSHTKPDVVNVFYVNHQGQQVWYNYDAHLKKVGNQKYMYHGTTRACNIGDDNLQTTACQMVNCGVCHILRATLDPSRAKPDSMFGIGAYVAPNSSKSANPRYCKNANPANSQNVVLLRCAVAVGNTYRAKKAMKGVTKPPKGHDSITGLTKAQGGQLQYPETAVFTKDAILPVEIIVLRYPNPAHASPYTNFTKRLVNITGANWNLYPEAIRDTHNGEILWTDGNASFTFPSAPRIRAYKVVRRRPAHSPTGTVIAEGYASSSPFYFRLE